MKKEFKKDPSAAPAEFKAMLRQLWPLTRVEPVEGWEVPPQPKLREFELAVGTVPALGSALVLIEVAGQPWWLGLLCGLLLWPIGLFVGLSARQALERRRTEIDSAG